MASKARVPAQSGAAEPISARHEPAVPIPTPEEMRRILMQRILERFHKDGSNVENVNAATIEVICSSCTTRDGWETMEALMRGEQIRIDDARLAGALGLREWREDDVAQDGTRYSYVRSFPLTVQELLDTIEYMREKGYWHPRLDEWIKAVDGMSLTDLVYIRYIGTVLGPRSPSVRFWEDVRSRKTGLLGHFLQALVVRNTEALDRAKVFTCVAATLPPGSAPYLGDLYERMLIAVCDREYILNIQPGGFLADHTPSTKMTSLFAGLHMSPVSALVNAMQLHDEDERLQAMNNDIDELYAEIDTFSETHSTALRTDRYPLSQETKAMLRRQASPTFLLSGSAVVVSLADSITITDYMHARSFYAGDSRAASITRDYLKSFARADGLDLTPETYELLFPFVDLFPFLSNALLLEHIGLMRRWCEIVTPIITITYGRQVSSIAKADFLHEHGLPSHDYLDAVGVPFLFSFADPSWVDGAADTPPDSSFSIAIPHLDPGVDKYGEQPPCLRELMYILWAITFAGIQLAIASFPTLLDEGLTRRAALERILEDIRRAIRTLQDALKGSKEALRVIWDARFSTIEKHSRVFSTEARSRMSAQATKRMERGQVSNGTEEQLEFIWRTNHPDLHLKIPHEPSRKEDWKAWARRVPVGKSFWMSLLHDIYLDGQPHPLAPVLRCVAPPGAADDTWMQDPDAVTAACKRRGALLRAKLPSDHFESEKQRLRITSWLQTFGHHLFASDLHDLDITDRITSHGDVLLYWLKDPEKIKIKLFLSSSARIRGTVGEKRVLVFTPEGIEVVDGSQKSVGALVKKEDFCARPQGEVLQDMWESHMSLHHPSALPAAAHASSSSSAAASSSTSSPPSASTSYGPPGRLPKGVPKKKHFGVLTRGDTQWLVYEFLRTKFQYSPESMAATEVCTLDKAYDDHSDHWPSLYMWWNTFLEEHKGHPRYDAWKSSSRRWKDWSGPFRLNLDLFCTVTTMKQVHRQVDGKQRDFRVWKFKARGDRVTVDEE